MFEIVKSGETRVSPLNLPLGLLVLSFKNQPCYPQIKEAIYLLG